MSAATLVLGRDGMGDNVTEADFDAWVGYVCEYIDEATGLDVDVQTRGVRDVQDDAINADDAQAVHDALQGLWKQFCADPAAWPVRAMDYDEMRDCLGLAVHGRSRGEEA